jgi:acyl-coenzyme A thioesterase PaaI-like protein
MNLQPSSDYCFVCGRKNTHGLHMQFYDDGQDKVVSDYTVCEPFQGYPGLVHGGILSAMLDEVVGRVALIGDHHHFMMTVKLEVKFRHPVPVNTPLRLVGERVKIRGRIGQACGRIELPDGTIAVEASLVLADIPEPFRQDDPAALGWRVDE